LPLNRYPLSAFLSADCATDPVTIERFELAQEA
jgi:hypothetical protein